MRKEITIHIDSFERYGRRYYNCYLLIINAVGATLTYFIKEYSDTSKLSELARNASIEYMKYQSHIDVFLREGERQAQIKIDFESQG